MSRKKPSVKKDYSAWKTVKRLVRDLKPIAWAICIAAVICCLSVWLAVLVAPEIVNSLTQMIYDYGAEGKPIDMKFAADLSVNLALAYAGSALLQIAMTVLMTNISSRFYTKGLRIRISDKLQRLPVSFIDATPNGELLSRMMNDVSNMSNTVYVIIETLLNGFVRIVVITYTMYAINWILATAVVVLVPLSIALSAFISSKSEKAGTISEKSTAICTRLSRKIIPIRHC